MKIFELRGCKLERFDYYSKEIQFVYIRNLIFLKIVIIYSNLSKITICWQNFLNFFTSALNGGDKTLLAKFQLDGFPCGDRNLVKTFQIVSVVMRVQRTCYQSTGCVVHTTAFSCKNKILRVFFYTRNNKLTPRPSSLIRL